MRGICDVNPLDVIATSFFVVRFRAGKTRVYAVSQDARTVVLLKGKKTEVQRIPVKLLAGRVNVIQP